MKRIALPSLLLATFFLALGVSGNLDGLVRGRLVHSFPPTPLFRGIAGTDGEQARAQVTFNNRGFGRNAANEPAPRFTS